MKEDKERCVFCKILSGTFESSVVYEDNLVVAFMDIKPVNPGHILIIPKVHIPYIKELDKEIGCHLFKIGMMMNKALRNSNLKCEGINYFLADGEAAMQEVFHVHLHVFPRYSNDGFGLSFSDEYGKEVSREELNKIAEDIRKYI